MEEYFLTVAVGEFSHPGKSISKPGNFFNIFHKLLKTRFYTQREKCPHSRIWTEYGKILRISSYLVQMRENADTFSTQMRENTDTFLAVTSSILK